jgi:type II secretion system protein G
MKAAILATLVCLSSLAAAGTSGDLVSDEAHPKEPSAALNSEAMIALAKTDIRMIATALVLYRVDYQRYPTTAEGLRALVEGPTDPAALPHWHKGGYLRSLPKDPWGHDYQYANPGAHGEQFDLYSLGPSGNDSKLITSWKVPAN